MAVDWSGIDDAIQSAGDKTDAALASQVSSLTRLTDAEVKQLFPTHADLQELSDLMKIVKGATDDAAKQKALISNIEDVAGAVVTLVAKFA